MKPCKTIMICALLCSLLWVRPTLAGYMIADISAQTLIKGVDFIGREVSISGVSDDNTNILAVINGPTQDYKVWQKKRKAGIWSKRDPHFFKSIPSYFFVASSYDISSIPGFPASALGLQSQSTFLPYIIKQDDKEYSLELIKIKQKSGLYQTAIGPIERIGKQIFRFKAYIPSTASIGKYSVDIYKVNGSDIGDKVHLEFYIDNVGFDQAITKFSHDNPLKYGILAVIISIVIGSLIGFLFRKDR